MTHRTPSTAATSQDNRRSALVALGLLVATAIAAGCATHWIVGGSWTGLDWSLALFPVFGVLHAWLRARWRPGHSAHSGHSGHSGPNGPGGRSGRGTPQLDLVVGVPLIWFLGLNHRWLSTPGSERLVAGLLYLAATLIFLRTLTGVAALRMLRFHWRTHRRVPVSLGVLAFALFGLLVPWTLSQRGPDGDEPWYLLVTHSLAYDFDAALDDNYERKDSLQFMSRAIEPQPGDPTDRAGNLRSRHGSALPLLLAPSYRVGGRTGVALTMAAFTSLFAWLLLHWTIQVFGPRASLLPLFVLLVVTSPLLLYSSQVWVEVPAGILAVSALLCVHRLRSGLHLRWSIGLLLCIVLLPLLKIRFGLLSIGIVAVTFFRLPLDRRQRLTLIGAGGVGLLGVLGLNAARFGNPLRLHAWEEILMPLANAVPMVQRLLGYVFDPAFGLAAFAPLWLALIPGLWWLARECRTQTNLLLAVFAPYLIYAAARQEWYGGWSPPFRYALVSLPLAFTALAAASLHRRRVGAQILWPPLVGVSLALGAVWTAVPGWTFNFANGSALWLDRLSELTGVDWMLWAPSATRPTRVTWVAPLLFIVVLLAAWNVGPRRSGRRVTALGACVLLAGLACGCVAIARMPTTVIEAESIRVSKTGGQPEPPRWTFDRTRFPEAWTLPNGAELVAPIRSGGSQVEIEISSLFIRNRNEDLVVHIERQNADGRWEAVGGLRLQEPGWGIHRLGPVDWGGAERLRVRSGPPLFDREPGVLNGVAIDRIRLRWP